MGHSRMSPLWMTYEQAVALIAAANQERPQEACGILVGKNEQVEEVISIRNIAADPAHFYRLDDQAFTQALFQTQNKGQTLLAFYHSHPTSDPIPSQEDIRQITYPDIPYVIVGFRKPEPELAAWQIRPGEVKRMPLHIGFHAPPPPPSFSQAQKTAVLLTALIAFVFLIVLSLSLLPPAPVIVTPLP